jgi:hypothetical protein
MKTKGIKKSDILISILFLGISFLTFFESLRVKKHLSTAEYLTPLRTDIYLQGLGWMVAFFTILFILKEIRGSSDLKTIRKETKLRHLMFAMVLYIFYILSTPWLGYVLSTLLFFLIFLRWVGKYSYLKTFTFSTLITICFYLIFIKGFEMALPAGIIENLFL